MPPPGLACHACPASILSRRNPATSGLGLPAQSGVGAPSPDGKDWGPIPQPVRRRPTRRPRGRAVRAAALGERRRRRRLDPRRQRHPLVRDALAGASTDLGGRCAPTNRYRGTAMAEFMRALRTLQALQAEQAAGADVLEMPPLQLRALARLASRPAPNEPERRTLNRCVILDQPGSGRTLHEPAACWLPNEAEPGAASGQTPAGGGPRRMATTGRWAMRLAASWGSGHAGRSGPDPAPDRRGRCRARR
jgi:hypothetical protein